MKLSVAFISIVALAATAHADNKDKADSLFKQGKKLMGEKRYADACEAFEKSFKLDPVIGTQLNIAKCYEDWGKIGRAFSAYQAAEKMAKDANDSRAPKIHELIVDLEPDVPHLTIKVPKDAPSSLEVTLDARPVDTLGEPFVIDPGPHTIEWSVKGSAKKSKIVAVDRGGDSEVTLDVPKVEDTTTGTTGTTAGDTNGKPDDKVESPPAPGRNMRLGGIALAGAGVIAIGVSGYMAFSAKSKYDDGLEMYCGGMANNCDMMGLEVTHDARSTANKATIVFLVGAGLVGGGIAMYVLAPKGPAPTEQRPTALYVTPSVSPDGVGVVFGGQL